MSNKKKIDTKETGYDNRSRETDRMPRKKVYQPHQETKIPAETLKKFRDKGFELKLIRWSLGGQEDSRSLSRRTREGYVFVTRDELDRVDPLYSASFQERNTNVTNGVLVVGDSCLVKIAIEDREARREYYQEKSRNELNSVDANVISKKHDLINNNSSTKVSTREPTFRS